MAAREYPADLKPMKYREPYHYGTFERPPEELPFEILYEGEYRGVKFRITNNRGYNPCCYIKIPDSLLYNPKLCTGKASARDYYEDIVDVHGGVTWVGSFDWSRPKDAENNVIDCIGWDYGHLGDWTPSSGDYIGFFGGSDTKWTSEMLYDECIEAIDNILDEGFRG